MTTTTPTPAEELTAAADHLDATPELVRDWSLRRELSSLLRSKAAYAPPRDQRPLLDLARVILATKETNR